MKTKKFFSLIFFIVVCNLAGAMGALLTATGEGSWYMNLVKPSFNPPGWLFGPVWTMLYILMGIAVWMIWQQKKDKKIKIALNLFWLQLVLNAIWTPVFFGLENTGVALGIIIVLWLVLLVTIIKFWQIKKTVAGLLVPYILWVSFASVLNFAIWWLN